uniref:Uncharacterized protein n=1 Tax=Rangifer tarandus platyrhynchus TaxID=3082113 RepID=A0ACB0E638_RANTA|nr:unnamed protein product [Rangifer tarandus platyrhynchus]
MQQLGLSQPRVAAGPRSALPGGRGGGGGKAGERRGGEDAEPGPAARPNCATHTHTRARALTNTLTRARGSRGAPPSCVAAISPPARARPLADSPFSSNKDINPTLLARDWDEVRRANPSPRRGGGGSAASSGRARRRRAAGRGCPSDVRGPHPSAPGAWRPGTERRRSELQASGRLPRQPAARGGRGGGEDGGGGAGLPPLHRTHLWNVLALTEQRRRRAQATLDPSARPPRQAAQPIGWQSARARSSLACMPRLSRLSPPFLLPEAPLAASARPQTRVPASLSRSPLPRFSQRPSRSRESGRASAAEIRRYTALCRFGCRGRWRLVPPPPLAVSRPPRACSLRCSRDGCGNSRGLLTVSSFPGTLVLQS